ncbi:MAG: TonB-dependent receptor [candidate division Zixibacteria bacterium]|nr:TonB-dependent receptor [candidate division Zixibacteria bacterium]
MSTRLTITLTIALLLLCGVGPSGFAKVSGKISGTVEDSESGDPLHGATVRVDGTNLVTQCDEDGDYFIIGVPVGKYDLSVSHVGYESMTKKEVRVLVDLTTPVDFAVPQIAVELPDMMIVYASAPVVQKDLTASKVIFTEERLKNLPNIQSVQAILTNYPGVVVDRDNSLHIRGGRSGQVTYYLDGFSVQDPFSSTAGIRIMPTALEELSLTSGGFTAGYGEALSGVVSAVTPEGGTAYRGRLRAYSAATHEYDVRNGEWGSLGLTDNRSVSFNFSGPLPGQDGKRYSFFSAGEYLRGDSYLPHNWSTYYTGMTKVTIHPSNRFRIKANATYSIGDGARYQHRDVNGRSYDFNLNGLPLWDREAYLAGISGHYTINDHMLAFLNLDRFSTRTEVAPPHLQGVHWSQWPGYSEDEFGVYNGTIQDDNYGNNPDQSDPAEAVGFTGPGDFDPTYSYRMSQYNSISGSVVDQMGKKNQLTAGFEYRRYSIDWDFKQFYNDQPYGEAYTSSPTYASVFAEDKLEYEDFVVNVGLRLDYRNADVTFDATPTDTSVDFREAEAKTSLSPRIGVSFPVSDRSVVHFNYGVYYQQPRYDYLYTNLEGRTNTGLPQIGNPDLDPEETISYEVGLDHMIGESLRLDATAYNKDINDLVTMHQIDTIAGNPITRYTNDDYGSVIGVDLSLEKLPGTGYLSGSVSYGYMMAKGSGSNASEPYYTYLTSNVDTLPPVGEYYLDFDQRHTVTAVLDFRVPANWNAKLFGMKIPGAWGVNMVGYYGSGFPYTRVDSDGNRLGQRNEERLPASYSVDMRVNKDFTLGKRNQILTMFVEVDNVFNRRNIIDVYSRTGRPDDDAVTPSGGLALDADDLARFNRLYDLDPENYSAPRTIRTGLELSF